MNKILIISLFLLCGCTSTQFSQWGTVLGSTANGMNTANKAYQSVDLNCVNNCLNQGNLMAYCNKLCSY